MKKLFAILVMLSLSMPVEATIDTETEAISSSRDNLELIHPDDNSELVKEESDIVMPESLPSPYKEPFSKKKLAKKFAIAMLCVAGCSLFLYVSLSAYNKVRDAILTASQPIPPEGEKPLDTPADLTDAVKTFIDKTKWG